MNEGLINKIEGCEICIVLVVTKPPLSYDEKQPWLERNG